MMGAVEITAGQPSEKLAQEFAVALLPRPAIAREGWPRTGLLALVSLVSWRLARGSGLPAVLLRAISRLSALLTILTAFAYRNPHREPLGRAPDYFYSPVDGTVELVERMEEEPVYLDGPAYKLRIRSHLLDVPVLRSPLAGRVSYLHRRRGVAARIGLDTAAGRLLITCLPNPHSWLRLPPGLRARNVVAIRPQAGQELAASQTLGVRGFGFPLQTILYLPAPNTDILCRAGQHVQAGMSVVGRIKPA